MLNTVQAVDLLAVAEQSTSRTVSKRKSFTSGKLLAALGTLDNATTAGENYRQVGSDVIAPSGDIDIAAKTVDILEARETSRTITETKSKQSGLTIAVSSPVVSAIQTVQRMSEAASNTKDPRMQLLAAANIGLSTNNVVDAVTAGQGTTINDKEGQIATAFNDKGEAIAGRDANAADQVGGINVSISIGSSKSSSRTTQTSNTAAASNLTAGRDITITASGAGSESDLLIQGAKITAAKNLTLTADDEIRLLAAANTSDQKSTNQNSSASLGVGFALGGTQNGFTIQAGVSGGQGKANGADLNWTNTQLEAGNTLTLESGGDTTLRGAVARGEQVIANIGKDLKIESLQDTSTYDSKQKSLGASVSLCIPPFCYGAASTGSVSASGSKVNSDFASVGEQSGIRAGDGGFQVAVKGDTDLKGGAITSTQTAIDDNKNSFNTDGTLTLSDIQNKAEYTAKSASVNVGTGFSAAGALTPQGTSAGFGKDGDKASSTTLASISGVAGNTAARTGDKETGIAKIFDADKVQKEIDAQTQITQMFGQLASKAVGDYADTKLKEATALRDQAGKETDTGRVLLLETQASELENQWGANGTLRLAAHTVIGGLTGGVSGAAGAAAGTITAPLVADALAEAGVDANLGKVITALASTAVGAAVGGTSGAGAALNEVANNYLNHVRPSLLRLSEKERYEKADAACNSGDSSACATRNELAALSRQRDIEFQLACSSGTPDLCNTIAREAIAMGNIVYGANGQLVYANSPESGAIRFLNTATIGAVGRPDSFHDQLATSTAEGLLLEGQNQLLGALIAATGKGVAAANTAVKDYFASSGILVSEDVATRIALNFGRDGDRFTAVAEQMAAAKNAGWINAEGKTWWPPSNGVVPGTEFQTSLPVGMRLDRYGGTSPNATFLAPSGTPLGQRALSPTTNTAVYEEYIVVKPFAVEQSNVMPWFGKNGMGRQFDTQSGVGLPIQELVKQGYLKKVTP